MKWNSGRLWLRITVYGLLTLLTALVVVQSLIFWQFDELAVRQTLARVLQDQHRSISIHGPIKPHVLPFPGLDINRIDISEPGNAPPAISIDHLEARLAWLPLLFGEREVNKVSIAGLKARVARHPDGTLSIADLFQRRETGRFRVKLDTLRLRDGQIDYLDLASHRQQTLNAISLDADGLRGDAHLTVGALLSGGKRPLRLALETPLTIQDDQVTLSQLQAVVMSEVEGLGQSKLNASGLLRLNFAALQATGEQLGLTLSSDTPQSTFTLRVPAFSASFKEVTTPLATLDGQLTYGQTHYETTARFDNVKLDESGLNADRLAGDLSWSVGRQRVNLQLDAPFALVAMNQIRMQPLALMAQVVTPLLPRGQLVAKMEGALDGTLDDDQLNLRVAGKLDGSDMAITVSQFGFLKPRHEATVTIGKLDLNRYLPESKDNAAVALFQDTRPIPLDWLDYVDLSGKVTVGELAFGRFRINDVSASVLATPQQLALDQLSASIYQGRLEGSIRLAREQKPTLELKQTLNAMHIRPLLVDLFNFNRLDGVGSGQVDIKARGVSFAELRNTMSGTVAMSLNKGALSGIDLVAALKNLPSELKQWNGTANPDQKTTFSTLSASLQLEQGVARNQDLKLASQLINVSGGGKLDLIQSIIDYTLDVQANPHEFSRLKGVNVPLKITGPINSPVYALDFNAMVKGKKTESEKQDALKQQLKKQITTILP
ncbi:MAG: AsmA family protein [Pseudogulbenkiania sp.]|nr:AsmA family protein [Pseudogulbenkiania sp.]